MQRMHILHFPTNQEIPGRAPLPIKSKGEKSQKVEKSKLLSRRGRSFSDFVVFGISECPPLRHRGASGASGALLWGQRVYFWCRQSARVPGGDAHPWRPVAALEIHENGKVRKCSTSSALQLWFFQLFRFFSFFPFCIFSRGRAHPRISNRFKRYTGCIFWFPLYFPCASNPLTQAAVQLEFDAHGVARGCTPWSRFRLSGLRGMWDRLLVVPSLCHQPSTRGPLVAMAR